MLIVEQYLINFTINKCNVITKINVLPITYHTNDVGTTWYFWFDQIQYFYV